MHQGISCSDAAALLSLSYTSETCRNILICHTVAHTQSRHSVYFGKCPEHYYIISVIYKPECALIIFLCNPVIIRLIYHAYYMRRQLFHKFIKLPVINQRSCRIIRVTYKNQLFLSVIALYNASRSVLTPSDECASASFAPNRNGSL